MFSPYVAVLITKAWMRESSSIFVIPAEEQWAAGEGAAGEGAAADSYEEASSPAEHRPSHTSVESWSLQPQDVYSNSQYLCFTTHSYLLGIYSKTIFIKDEYCQVEHISYLIMTRYRDFNNTAK